MLYPDVAVKLPTTRISFMRCHGSSGDYYVYYCRRSHRIEGKLKHDRILIGKKGIDESGVAFLIPNDKYYVVFGGTPPSDAHLKKRGRSRLIAPDISYHELQNGSALGFGYGLACIQVARKLNLLAILEETFGDELAMRLICLASFFACGAKGTTQLEYFCRTQMCFSNVIMSSPRASELYLQVDNASKHEFFQKWVANAKGDELICYDVTSISTWAETWTRAAYGYNRDKEKLKQINLGLFTTINGDLPLFYVDYNGNINDFTNFPLALTQANSVGITSTFRVVMDAGFATGSTIDFTSLHGCRFIVGAPLDHCPGVRSQIEDWRNHADKSTEIFSEFEEDVASFEVPFSMGQTQGRLIMYCSNDLKHLQEGCFRNALRRMEKSLGQIDTITKEKAQQYSPYFNVTINKDGSYQWERNLEKIRIDLNSCGCFALFTNDPTISHKSALEFYREKDVVEKSFADLKNEICEERLYVHSDVACRGKLFVLFLGLILRRVMSRTLHGWIKKNRSSVDTVFEMLKDIECIKHGTRWVLSKAFTKQQKEIIAELGLPVHTLVPKKPSQK